MSRDLKACRRLWRVGRRSIQRSKFGDPPQRRSLPPSEWEAGFRSGQRCAIRRNGYQSKTQVEIRVEIPRTVAASKQSGGTREL